jgi:stage III sporulation protein AE
MIPAMGVLYALGGNIGRAAVNAELMLVLMTVCEYVSVTVTPPVCAVCMSFSLMDALGARLTLTPLCEQIKKWYVSLLGLVTFLLSLSLSARSVLAGQADSLGMKGVKYAVGNTIPVVGGAIAGTLSAVAAGVSALRGVCGVAGIILISLLLLPTLVELLLTRAILRLAATVAALLSCEGEAKLMGEMASLHGYLAAAASICAVAFTLSLTLLIHSGTAIT